MADPISRLFGGKFFIEQLVNQPLLGKGRHIQIGFCALSRLFVPVCAAMIGSINSVCMGELLVFQLSYQALIGKIGYL